MNPAIKQIYLFYGSGRLGIETIQVMPEVTSDYIIDRCPYELVWTIDPKVRAFLLPALARTVGLRL